MTEYLRAFMVEGQVSEMGSPIRFVASTEGVKRDGLDLKAEDWFLGNFERNPVVTWAHDILGKRLPIGRAGAFVEGARLMADVTFDPGDEFAVQVERKYRSGFLHTVSVQWNPLMVGTRRVNDLMEIAAVPVPGDPDAVIQRQLRAWREIGLTDDGTVGSGLVEEIRAVKAAVTGLDVQFEAFRQRLWQEIASSDGFDTPMEVHRLLNQRSRNDVVVQNLEKILEVLR